jgi:DNA-binding LacI/PurR family transcriptional regulator
VLCAHSTRELGLRVPDDFSIAGFDDLPVTEILDPPLTTVGVPMRELGRQGMTLLLERTKGKAKNHHAKLACNLVVRSSTGPPPHSAMGRSA